MNISDLRKLYLLMTLITWCPVAARSQDSACDPRSDAGCASASQVGKDVQQALVNANATGLSNLQLRKAVLTLETSGTTTDGVSINFLIFTVKHQAKKGDTMTQQITWGALPKPAGVGAPEKLKEVLARAVATAAQIAGGVTSLPLTEATITIKFVVDKDNGGSISYKIIGLNLGPNIDFDKVSTNTLAVTFSK
jgi:hypothetical protein